MAFPFEYKTDFQSVEHTNFTMDQRKFILLRQFMKRKFPEAEMDKSTISYTLDKVFGVLSFDITILYEEKRMYYKIDMIPVFLISLFFAFLAFFIQTNSVIAPLMIGFLALVLIYFSSLIIVNGMVRRALEDFVEDYKKRKEPPLGKSCCLYCGEILPPGHTKCPHCGLDNNPDTPDNTRNVNIEYQYNSDS